MLADGTPQQQLQLQTHPFNFGQYENLHVKLSAELTITGKGAETIYVPF